MIFDVSARMRRIYRKAASPPPIEKDRPVHYPRPVTGRVLFFCVLSATYVAFRVSVLSPRSLPFREIRHTPLLFRLQILRILTPILRTSSGLLHFVLQPLLGDLVSKLVDTLHDLSQTGR